MINSLVTPDYIFESSWEVCNKVGGIYTVLSTRAKVLQELFPDKIYFIGPDLWQEQTNPDFIEDKTLLKAWKKHAAEQESLKIRTGRWNVPGNPIVILVDFIPYYDRKDEVYFRMWEKYGIDSTVAYGDYDEASMFAFAVGMIMESLYSFFKLQDKKVIAHLNEWMLGMAALYLHDRVPGIATIFTTHATSIGRSICGNNKPLYSEFHHYNGDQMAYELNMVGKHTLEKQAALHVDCFTTVSWITGQESEQFLGKKPDIITPNGFEPNWVPKGKKFDTQRETARKAFLRVAEQLTGTSLPADALLVATSGRYEYRNKGIDVFIEALYRVKQAQPARTVIAFILVPTAINGPRKDLQERLKQTVLPSAPLPDPYFTHELIEYSSDKVCHYLRYFHFTNQDDSSVKLIFVPSYLNGYDGIFNLSYYDLLIGLDLTIFPSYYEPWGYTPLESIAFHVPTITTLLAGFGLWAQEEEATGRKRPDRERGVTIIHRTDTNYFEVAETIKETVIRYSEYDSQSMAEIRKDACALSRKADWAHFIRYYLEAYAFALQKVQLRK
ncbi:MAG: glycogen/starch synthase [Dysgonamonadaceae bacterium]|jgi:glycogen synthase|nr:glycogen/starch synthase [Dysgonamonadaceae bacterium]